MDLFIIIAAVLAVGGVVAAAVFGLAGSASSNTSLQIVQASGQGSTTGTGINAFSITLKNTGSTSITSQVLTITLGGTSGKSATGNPTPSYTATSGSSCAAAPTITDASTAIVTLSCTATITPGGQLSINLGGALTSTQLTTGWTSGSTYTISVAAGGAQTSVNINV